MITKHRRNKFILLIIISLTLAVFLLIPNHYVVLASEVSLSTKLSVKVPDPQSGNPGEFVTFVLELENRADIPVTLEAECSNELQWNILSEPNLTIPAHTKNLFPISVQIPQNAPNQTESAIKVLFKLKGSEFPTISIPITVNPKSDIVFTTESNTTKGNPGSIMHYQIVVTNNGNTSEQIAVKSHSEHFWKTIIQPESFHLNPGESMGVNIDHFLPFNAQNDSDQLSVTFNWNQNQKSLTLTSVIDTPLNNPTDRFYIWQSDLNLYHPNLTETSSNSLSNSFSLKGQIAPNTFSQFYFSDLFNSNNSNQWFIDVKYLSSDLRAGKFSLDWPGLMAPAAPFGNLYATDKIAGHNVSFYSWQSANSNTSPIGLETELNSNSKLRFLQDSQSNHRQSVLEWYYQETLPAEINASTNLAYNLANPDNYGYGLSLRGKVTDWYWTSTYQYLKNYLDYFQKQNIALIIGQPFTKNHSVFQEYQLRYEFADTIATAASYYDFLLMTTYKWSPELQMILSNKHHSPVFGLPSDSTSLFIQDSWQEGLFSNDWWLTVALDSNPSAFIDPNQSALDSDSSTFEKYAKLNWETTYSLDSHSNLVLNPQLVSNSIPDSTENSKLGFGYEREWDFGPKWSSFMYYVFQPSDWNVQLLLDWPIYQYHLIFKYSTFLGPSTCDTDICSISFNQNFTLPIRKPLGTIEGTAFLDLNQNGVMDNDEPKLHKIELFLDGTRSFISDNNGHYSISGVKSNFVES